jgi:hypothetical protein
MLQGNGRLRESLPIRKGKQVTMYTVKNYKTKRDLKADVAAGKRIEVFQPGGFFPGKTDGTVTLEGPHYPQPHTWYATAEIRDSVIIKIRG